MLTSFVLKPEIEHLWNEGETVLDLNPAGYHVSETCMDSLYQAITWAIAHDEDLIYCICDQHASVQFDWDILSTVIHDLVPEKVSMLFIDAKYESSIVVNQHCVAIDGVEAVSSFILVRPIYNFVLAILENREEIIGMDWLNFLQFIAPHSFLFSPYTIEPKCDIKFHIVSPFRNAANYLNDYLISLQKQVHRNFHAYLIDDCSDDGSSELIEESDNITCIINSERKYALRNIIHVLTNQNIADNDVVCILDADDRFPHKYVLNILSTVYTDDSVLCTYGSLQYFEGYRRYGTNYTVDDFADIRKQPWKSTPLRTFRYKVFKEILSRDPELNIMKDDSGHLITMPSDMALFFPIMELAGYESTRFIRTPLYEYRLHEQNDQYVNRPEQYQGELLLRAKKGFRRHFI